MPPWRACAASSLERRPGPHNLRTKARPLRQREVGASTSLERMLILVKGTRDAELTRGLLGRDGVEGHVCASMAELCVELNAGAAAALLAEEVLTPESVDQLVAVLKRQP